MLSRVVCDAETQTDQVTLAINMASHEGPYLIHCTEGKDRTGFVSALLECLIGAGAESYLLSTGISSETIQTIKDNLKG